MYKRFFLMAALCCFFVINLYTQNTDEKLEADNPNSPAYKIESVEYSIKGFTKERPLSSKIPIDKKRIFSSREEFDALFPSLSPCI